jgi:hypothetical protein
MTRRLIRFRDGERNTSFTVTECAALRAARLGDDTDRMAYMDRFAVVRTEVLAGADEELLWRESGASAIDEAAHIEAFASLRAEGLRP